MTLPILESILQEVQSTRIYDFSLSKVHNTSWVGIELKLKHKGLAQLFKGSTNLVSTLMLVTFVSKAAVNEKKILGDQQTMFVKTNRAFLFHIIC